MSKRDEGDKVIALAYRLLELNPARLAEELEKLRAKLRETSGRSRLL